MTRWCLGLREKEVTNLSAQELSILLTHRKRSLFNGWIYLFAVPFVLSMMFLLAIGVGSILQTDSTFLGGITLAIGILLVLPIAISLSNDKFKIAANRKKDLKDKSLIVFEGQYDERLYDDPVFMAVQRGKRLNFSTAQQLRISVLNGSSTLISVNDTIVLDLSLRVQIAELVDPPEFAELAAQYLKPTEFPGLYVHQRSLTAEEKQELIRHMKKILKWPMILWTVFVASVALVSLFSILIGEPQKRSDIIRFVIFTIFSAISLYRLLGLIRLRYRINKDLQGGFVLIESHSIDSGETLSEVVEILPHSQLLWREKKRPSTWRSLQS